MQRIFSLIVLCSFLSLEAQESFHQIKTNVNAWGDVQIKAENAVYFELKIDQLKEKLWEAPIKTHRAQKSNVYISLPLPDGSTDNFTVFNAPTMEEALAQKFPAIRTFIFQSTSNPLRYGRADLTHKGFHLMLFSPEGSIFIDPFSSSSNTRHMAYFKKDFTSNKAVPSCLSHEQGSILPTEENIVTDQEASATLKSLKNSHGSILRTYRIAVSATGEYTQFHGGTVADGLAAIVTSINRVTGIYEREFTTQLILVANNDLIVYTDPNTDPFANPNNAGQLLGENQSSIDNTIGSANYDVGHVVGRSGSGLASFAVVCRNSKASATTGINNPIGDPFDVDYLAHEIGHQFGGSHTFNSNAGSCSGGNISSNSAYEPGSATTIMGYAGICSPHNVQNNSDDYFHTRNFDQVTTYITDFQGDNCPVKTNTGNNIPSLQILTPINKTIPISTPFQMQAIANDIDGDALTYCWEQFDLGPTGDPNNPSGNAPLFRSFQPTANPIRTFPQLSDIINNTQTLGEILPDYARGLTFRVTVRDNVPGGGSLIYDEIDVDVTSNAGPFVVSNPNTNIVWTAGDTVTVNWDVANTNLAPVLCISVNIRLSTDGGLTYPITLASNVPNIGVAELTAPFAITNEARVRVEAADNIFFDISDENFRIETNCASVDPSINITNNIPNTTWCVNTSGALTFAVNSPDLAITSYQWFKDGILLPNQTGPSLVINNVQLSDGGNYDCTISNGCSTVSTNTATVFVTSTQIIPTITQVGNQLQSSVPNNIQWYLDGTLLPGETNEFIDATQLGTYTVRSVAGPCSAFSQPFITSIKDFNLVADIAIVPNPTNDIVNIIASEWNDEIQIELRNVLGQKIDKTQSFQKETTLDLSMFSDGIYLLTLSSKAYQASYKIVKQ